MAHGNSSIFYPVITMRAFTYSAAAMVAALGWVSSAAAQRVPAMVRDSAGVQIVWSPGVTRMLDAHLESIIGQEDGAPEQMLHSVFSVAIDPAGTHFIGLEAEIRVFDASGTYVRTIGRRGQGPGEFGMPPFPIWFSGDSVMAMDRNLMRTTAFSRSGDVLGTYSSYAHRGLVVRPIAANDSSWIAIVEQRTDDLEDEEALRRLRASIKLRPGEIGEINKPELRRYYPKNDSVGRTLVTLRGDRIVGSSEEPGFIRRPFDDTPTYSVNERGMVVVKAPGIYQVDVFDPAGRHVRSIRRDYAPIPITRADFDGMPELLRDANAMNMIVRDGSRERALERMLQSMQQRVDRMKALPLPQHRSPVGRLMASAEGMLWVERSDYQSPALREAQRYGQLPVATRWDIFDRSGAYVGTVDLPKGFRPLAVNDRGRVTGSYRSDLGVEFVQTYSVRGMTVQDRCQPGQFGCG